ncbi:MAG: glycosyltransferase, partial [Planctomycetia bacterium]
MSDASVPTKTATHDLPLSIVAPVYNEEAVVERLVSEVVVAMSRRTAPWELVVVNDGSRDATLEKLVACQRRD